MTGWLLVLVAAVFAIGVGFGGLLTWLYMADVELADDWDRRTHI